MEDNFETFPTRKHGEMRSAYLRRVLCWKERFLRGIKELKLQRPISQNNTWVIVKTSNGEEHFYINVEQLEG